MVTIYFDLIRASSLQIIWIYSVMFGKHVDLFQHDLCYSNLLLLLVMLVDVDLLSAKKSGPANHAVRHRLLWQRER